MFIYHWIREVACVWSREKKSVQPTVLVCLSDIFCSHWLRLNMAKLEVLLHSLSYFACRLYYLSSATWQKFLILLALKEDSFSDTLLHLSNSRKSQASEWDLSQINLLCFLLVFEAFQSADMNNKCEVKCSN